MKHKKSYYEGNVYVDITTGRRYIPKGICQICGTTHNIQIHHYIEQQRCIRDLNAKKIIYPKTLTQEQINKKQKLFELCSRCHNAVHNMDDNEFINKFCIDRENFIYKG